jgi:hypothetical protein
LDQLYPDALFILNTRPLKSWVLSRHKAVERSRAAVTWALTKYVPLGLLARVLNAWVLDNDPSAMRRWIQIRNSFHEHAMEYFRDRRGKLLVLNIEDPAFPSLLGEFLGVEKPLSSEVANQDGGGSTTRIILDAIGKKVGKRGSQEVVDALFASPELAPHAESLTSFPSADYRLSRSASDQMARFLPFLRPVFRWLFRVLVGWRAGAKSFLTKGVLDTFIRFFRSEVDLNVFTTVRRLGRG